MAGRRGDTNKNANPIYIKTTNLQNYSVACVDTAATTLIGFSAFISTGSVRASLLAYGASNSQGAPLAGNAELASSAALVFTTGASHFRSIINASGQVGILNVAPAYALDVSGDVNTSGVYRVNGVPLATGSSQTPWTSDIDAAGHNLTGVGKLAIGTSTPQWLVTVAGPSPKTSGSNSLQAWMSSDPIASNPLTLALSLAGAATAAGRSANLQVTEWGTGTVFPNLILQNAGGSVGIGTASPTSRLSIAGDAQNWAGIAQTTISINDTDAANGGRYRWSTASNHESPEFGHFISSNLITTD